MSLGFAGRVLCAGQRTPALFPNASPPQRVGLGLAYSGGEYGIGFGPLKFRRAVHVDGVRLIGAKNLHLVAGLAADLSGPASVFPAVAAGNLVHRFPQTHWVKAMSIALDPITAATTAFAVQVAPDGLGQASFSAIALTYHVDCPRHCPRFVEQIPTSFDMNVSRSGPDPRSTQVEHAP